MERERERERERESKCMCLGMRMCEDKRERELMIFAAKSDQIWAQSWDLKKLTLENLRKPFLSWRSAASFCLFSFFSTATLQKNCRLKWESNSDRLSWKRARWPLEHHHFFSQYRLSVFPNILSFSVSGVIVCYYIAVFFVKYYYEFFNLNSWPYVIICCRCSCMIFWSSLRRQNLINGPRAIQKNERLYFWEWNEMEKIFWQKMACSIKHF